MEIKVLPEKNYKEAMKLKVHCATEEYAGLAPNNLDIEKEYRFFKEWINSADKYDDIRLVYGAYIGDNFAGVIGSSLVEGKEDISEGIEINYLYVEEKFRGKGASLKLIKKTLDEFSKEGVTKMIVYNYHHSPSNQFYRKLDGKVIKEEIQGETYKLPVDIFAFNLKDLQHTLNEIIVGVTKFV